MNTEKKWIWGFRVAMLLPIVLVRMNINFTFNQPIPIVVFELFMIFGYGLFCAFIEHKFRSELRKILKKYEDID